MSDRSPSPPAERSDARRPSEADENRGLTNLVLLIGFLVLVGGGIWLVDAMLDARRADECITSGRRNCSEPIRPQPMR